MAHIHHYTVEDSHHHALYWAAIVALVLIAMAAFYFGFSRSAAVEATTYPLPVLPPLYPMIPLM